ncbi:hypothetical protein B0H13DRAFT_2466639 [Mycena leptocephala]|nr:hypothetical protein B0H13DRAFT_2466639 [Mycena leptocephala]
MHMCVPSVNLSNQTNKRTTIVDQLVYSASCTRDLPFLQAWGTNVLDQAAARDVRMYLKSISSPALIGYADIEGASSFRDDVAQYLSCDPTGANEGASAVDLFGPNNCSSSSRGEARCAGGKSTERGGSRCAVSVECAVDEDRVVKIAVDEDRAVMAGAGSHGGFRGCRGGVCPLERDGAIHELRPAPAHEFAVLSSGKKCVDVVLPMDGQSLSSETDVAEALLIDELECGGTRTSSASAARPSGDGAAEFVKRALDVFAVHELECAVGDDLERAEHEDDAAHLEELPCAAKPSGDDCLRGKQERCCHRDAGRTHFFLHVDVGACGDSARGSNPCALPGRDLLRLDARPTARLPHPGARGDALRVPLHPCSYTIVSPRIARPPSFPRPALVVAAAQVV